MKSGGISINRKITEILNRYKVGKILIRSLFLIDKLTTENLAKKSNLYFSSVRSALEKLENSGIVYSKNIGEGTRGKIIKEYSLTDNARYTLEKYFSELCFSWSNEMYSNCRRVFI